MKVTKITLEDKGQDFLRIYVNGHYKVIKVEPFGSFVIGATIPIGTDMVEVGKLLPVHNPPYVEHGFFKYKIEKIELVEI